MARRRFRVGDLVRFEGGKVDWTVASVARHPTSIGIQRITLKSGMTDRVMHTTNEYLIPRDEVLAAQEGVRK